MGTTERVERPTGCLVKTEGENPKVVYMTNEQLMRSLGIHRSPNGLTHHIIDARGLERFPLYGHTTLNGRK